MNATILPKKGARFGSLVVVCRIGETRTFLMECDCGAVFQRAAYRLSPVSRCAECWQHRGPQKRKIGERYGSLTIIGMDKDSIYRARCDCGREVRRIAAKFTNSAKCRRCHIDKGHYAKSARLRLRVSLKTLREIRSGEKSTIDYPKTEYWRRRLVEREYPDVLIRGPAEGPQPKPIVRPWNGYKETTKTINGRRIEVYRIDVNER